MQFFMIPSCCLPFSSVVLSLFPKVFLECRLPGVYFFHWLFSPFKRFCLPSPISPVCSFSPFPCCLFALAFSKDLKGTKYLVLLKFSRLGKAGCLLTLKAQALMLKKIYYLTFCNVLHRKGNNQSLFLALYFTENLSRGFISEWIMKRSSDLICGRYVELTIFT